MTLVRLFLAIIFASLLMPLQPAYSAPKIETSGECCDDAPSTPCKNCGPKDAQKSCCTTTASLTIAITSHATLSHVTPGTVRFPLADFPSSTRFDTPPSPPPRA